MNSLDSSNTPAPLGTPVVGSTDNATGSYRRFSRSQAHVEVDLQMPRISLGVVDEDPARASYELDQYELAETDSQLRNLQADVTSRLPDRLVWHFKDAVAMWRDHFLGDGLGNSPLQPINITTTDNYAAPSSTYVPDGLLIIPERTHRVTATIDNAEFISDRGVFNKVITQIRRTRGPLIANFYRQVRDELADRPRNPDRPSNPELN